MLGLLLVIIAVIITIILFSIYKKNKVQKNGILLVGMSNSGKTAIFLRLQSSSFILTYTSMRENKQDYKSGNVTYKIIDIPGHERLRAKFFDEYKSLAKGIVFVIDSVTVQNDIKDVAECLYNFLTDNYVVKNKPDILILCNKQEEALAKGSSVIKLMLENEMNILRTTKTSQLDSIGKTTDNVFLGKKGKDFEFSQLHPMKIDFAECYVKSSSQGSNLEELENWIGNLN